MTPVVRADGRPVAICGDYRQRRRKLEGGFEEERPRRTLVVRWGYNESEVLNSFRPGSQTIVRSVDEIEQKGLQVVPVLGAEPLPERLRQAHAEINGMITSDKFCLSQSVRLNLHHWRRPLRLR